MLSGSPTITGTLTAATISASGPIQLASGQVLAWNSDTGLSRTAAGIIAIGNGTNGNATGTLLCASIQDLTGAVTPSSAGGTALGSASLPFSSLYVGAAATNNIQITGTATAARTFTLPDANSVAVQPATGGSGQFVNGVSASGVLLFGTPSGGGGSNTITINSQTGTTYTVANSDQGKLVTFSNTSAVALTLPQAGTGGNFAAGWYAYFENRNTGAVTITPTTSTIDGASSIALAQNCGAIIATDGTNYFTMRGNIITALSATAHQFLTSVSANGVFTSAQPSAADLSNGTTGTAGTAGTAVVLATSPTITTPTISGNLALGSSSVLAWNSDTGLSRTAAGALALGNGSASDTSGNLTLTRLYQPATNTSINNTVSGVTVQTTITSITSIAGEMNTAGRWLHVMVRGGVSTGSTGGTWAIGIQIGGTTLISQSYSPGNSVTNKAWLFMADIVTDVTGSSGSFIVNSDTHLEGIATDCQYNSGGAVGTFNLTTALTINLFVTPSQSATSTTCAEFGISREN